MLYIAFIFLVLFSANAALLAQTTLLVQTDKTEDGTSIKHPTNPRQVTEIITDMEAGKTMRLYYHLVSIFDHMSNGKINIR